MQQGLYIVFFIWFVISGKHGIIYNRQRNKKDFPDTFFDNDKELEDTHIVDSLNTLFIGFFNVGPDLAATVPE